MAQAADRADRRLELDEREWFVDGVRPLMRSSFVPAGLVPRAPTFTSSGSRMVGGLWRSPSRGATTWVLLLLERGLGGRTRRRRSSVPSSIRSAGAACAT